jgi:excisionase family DNA binding protein
VKKDDVGRLAYTYGEAAQLAGVSQSMVRKLVREGKLEKISIGRSVRIPRGEIERLCGAMEPRK